MRTRSWSDGDLADAITQSTTWGQVARALGLKADGGSSYHRIRAVAAELGLDTSHFLGDRWKKGTGAGRNKEAQRAAKQRWYNDNKQVYLDRNRQRYEANRQRLDALKDVPCADCGGRFPPCVMDYDHRDGDDKLGNISAVLTRWSWSRILAEIAKCEIICANCHRIRTAIRSGRLDSGWGVGVPSRVLAPVLAGSSPAPEAVVP